MTVYQPTKPKSVLEQLGEFHFTVYVKAVTLDTQVYEKDPDGMYGKVVVDTSFVINGDEIKIGEFEFELIKDLYDEIKSNPRAFDIVQGTVKNQIRNELMHVICTKFFGKSYYDYLDENLCDTQPLTPLPSEK
jgi:hypothetical protein